jgi:hypothetical protein
VKAGECARLVAELFGVQRDPLLLGFCPRLQVRGMCEHGSDSPGRRELASCLAAGVRCRLVAELFGAAAAGVRRRLHHGALCLGHRGRHLCDLGGTHGFSVGRWLPLIVEVIDVNVHGGTVLAPTRVRRQVHAVHAAIGDLDLRDEQQRACSDVRMSAAAINGGCDRCPCTPILAGGKAGDEGWAVAGRGRCDGSWDKGACHGVSPPVSG